MSSLQYLLGALQEASQNPLEILPLVLSPFAGDPILNVLAVTTGVIVAVYVLGLSTGNHSFVDKVWSIVPVLYAWQFALGELACQSGGGYPRAAVAACIITVWGIRLSYNFYRKGGYAWDGEDYRWEVLRQSMSPARYHLFHIFFIAIAQNLLLTAITLPLSVVWHTTCRAQTAVRFNGFDALAIIGCVFCLIIEAVADQEQFDFHVRKHGGRLHASEKKRGFLAEGLFACSRHPNFFAEQSFWVFVGLFASASTGRWVGWWWVGVAGLIALFHGSTNFTEEISEGKYPAYPAYKRSVNRLVPKLSF